MINEFNEQQSAPYEVATTDTKQNQARETINGRHSEPGSGSTAEENEDSLCSDGT